MEPNIPIELLEQFEQGNVLLFVGERIVRDAEGQPMIDQLTAQLVARLDVADKTELDFPQTAQAYEDGHGRQALVQFMLDWFAVLGDTPQPSHRLIAGLTDCDVLATTCIDRQLETAFTEAGRPLNVIVGNVDVVFEDERRARLYKLRGSVGQVESLVLTESDYETFFEDQASVSVVLQGYLARKTIVFVGYDLADPYFKQLYRRVTAPLDHFARRAYAFGESPSPGVCRWCKRQGIEVIQAGADVFLQALARQLSERARPGSLAARPALAAPLAKRPYKLLDYYEAQDASIFFGRQQETQKLSSLIHAHRLVLLYGASGVGKTSLLLAGAVPRLESADLPYETVYVRALDDPTQVIRRALQRRLPEASLPVEGSLVDLVHAATRALGRPLVIILDQFEEFFIRLSPEFRTAFVAELCALYDARDVPVKVVLSLREDWLASVSEIEKRLPEVFRIKLRLLPLAPEQARLAITAPAEQLGVHYEPVLIERLLSDLVESSSPGADVMPPQLQLVCSALYDGLKPGEHLITLAAYERLGGARGVLQKYLDDELARLGKDEQALARDALEELVTSQRTKSVKTSGELAQALAVNAAALGPVLEKLVRARLLRPVEREGAERAYELAHEYLIAEIALGPEAVARKEAEELLRQGVDNWRHFSTLLSSETFTLVDAQCDRLRLEAEAQELMLRSALRHGQAVARWLAQMQDEEKALTIAQEVLVKPQGEAARQDLGKTRGDIASERLPGLAAQLTSNWRCARGAESACASDALWALRSYLPRRLRAQLALSRSPRLMRRVALPVVGVLVGAVLIGLLVWGPRFLTPKPKIEWVDIPAGEFLMGSDPKVDRYAQVDEQSQHKFPLPTYKIGKYEVTNAQYAQCVRATVCKEPTNKVHYLDPKYANHPVVYVTWIEARTFCQWVGGDLPTETQWEKAARGTDGRIYPWGNDAITCERANYGGCSGDTMPVGQHSPAGDSPYGVADMAGNVWEWTSSLYRSYPYQSDDGREDMSSSGYRVLRGGSFGSLEGNARASVRTFYSPCDVGFDNGFRCVSGVAFSISLK